MTRVEETLYRLQEWRTGKGGQSERLSSQVIAQSGYADVDPSHPAGGKDGGRDATCTKDGNSWIMAVYFPRGQQSFADIKSKFGDDLAAAAEHQPFGFVFVTNQEIRLAERRELRELGEAKGIEVDLFHLERVAHILDQPRMAEVRKRYLDIEPDEPPIELDVVVDGAARYFSAQDRDIMLARYIEVVEEEQRDQHRKPSVPSSLPSWMLGEVPAPLSDEEFEAELHRWRTKLVAGWDDSLDYLAASAWPGVRIRVRNTGEVYLHHVQVIITIPGVRGVDWLDPADFEHDRLLLPFRPRARSPYDLPSLDFSAVLPAGAMEWENRGESLVITIDLERLPSLPGWDSDVEELVLVLNEPKAEPLLAEWTVTAQGYGKHYSGPAAEVQVEAAEFAASFAYVHEASRQSDDE